MRANSLLLILAMLLASCFASRRTERVTVKDTVIVPPIVRLDTLTEFKDRFIYLKDSTGQMTVTIEKVKNNYIRVKGKCEPKTITVPVTKTVVRNKEVIVENKFYKYGFIALLLTIVTLIAIRRITGS